MFNNFMRRAVALLFVASVAVLPSCSDVDPTTPPRTTLTFDESDWPESIAIGQRVGFPARLVDGAGNPASDATITVTTNSPQIAELTRSENGDTIYLEGLRPGRAHVHATLQGNARYGKVDVVRGIPVVLSHVVLLNPVQDTVIDEEGGSFIARATGMVDSHTPMSDSGLKWSVTGDGAVTVAPFAGGDSALVTGVLAGEETVTVSHSYCAAECEQSFNVVVEEELREPVALKWVTKGSLTARAGMEFETQPAVQLIDDEGRNVRIEGMTISAAIHSGGGSLLGGWTATTDAEGVAQFAHMAIGGTVGLRTIRFNAGGIEDLDGSVTIEAGVATKVSLSGPATLQTNQVSSEFSVLMLDAYDNETGVTDATTLSLSSNTSGTATFYAADGVTVITSLTFPAGSGWLTFRYRDTAASGSRTITVARTSGDQVGSAQVNLSVTGGGSARWVSSSSTTSDGSFTNSQTVSRPSGVASGDLMIAVVTVGLTSGGSLPSTNTPSGWTEIRSDNRTGIRQTIYYRRISNIATESSSYNFTVSSNARFSVAISAYSGISSSSPINDSGNSEGTSQTITVSSQSAPSGGGTVLTIMGANNADQLSPNHSNTVVRERTGGSNSNRMTIAFGDDDVTGTSTSSRSATGTNGPAKIVTVVVLRPGS